MAGTSALSRISDRVGEEEQGQGFAAPAPPSFRISHPEPWHREQGSSPPTFGNGDPPLKIFIFISGHAGLLRMQDSKYSSKNCLGYKTARPIFKYRGPWPLCRMFSSERGSVPIYRAALGVVKHSPYGGAGCWSFFEGRWFESCSKFMVSIPKKNLSSSKATAAQQMADPQGSNFSPCVPIFHSLALMRRQFG